MGEVKAPDVPQPERKQPDLMTEERLHEILTIQPVDPLYQGEEITMLLMPMMVND